MMAPTLGSVGRHTLRSATARVARSAAPTNARFGATAPSVSPIFSSNGLLSFGSGRAPGQSVSAGLFVARSSAVGRHAMLAPLGARNYWSTVTGWLGLGSKENSGALVTANEVVTEAGGTAKSVGQEVADHAFATASSAAEAVKDTAPTWSSETISIVPPSAEEAAAALAEAIPQGPAQMGDLAQYPELHGFFVTPAVKLLESIHFYTGLPWWASIVIATLIFRTFLLTFVMPGIQRRAAILANKQPIIRPLTERLQAAKKAGDKDAEMLATAELQEKFKGASPFGMIGGMVVQFPFFIGMFSGMRAMAGVPVPGFTTEGALWFKDLSIADPTMGLPLLGLGTMIVINELGGEFTSPGMVRPGQKNMMRFFAIVMLITTYTWPAAFFVYFVTNNLFSLFQIWFFKQESNRARLNIPKILRYNVPGLHANPGNRMASFADSYRMLQAMDDKIAKTKGLALPKK